MNIRLFDNATVRVDAENLVCITDIYKIAIERGLDGGKNNPYDWSRPERKVKSGSTGKTDDVTSSGRQFIDFVAKSLNTEASRIYKTTRGKHGGTYAHWKIALAYAQYLSHELHERIETRKASGFSDCNKHCGQAARIVANAVSDALS